MRVEVIDGPTYEPITRAQAKTWCRIDADITDEDDLIDDLITRARRYIEGKTSRALAPQTLRAVFDGFPSDRVLTLPRFPLISVDSVTYDDASGNEQTFSSSSYRAVTHSAPGAIYAPGGWPATQPGPGTVRVQYDAGSWVPNNSGEGEDPAVNSEPLREDARQALLYLINHWYERRDAAIIGASLAELPDALRNLILSLKIWYRASD